MYLVFLFALFNNEASIYDVMKELRSKVLGNLCCLEGKWV